jgi:hypothetical protein
MAGHGRAWQGMAGHGRAWQGMAAQAAADASRWQQQACSAATRSPASTWVLRWWVWPAPPFACPAASAPVQSVSCWRRRRWCLSPPHSLCGADTSSLWLLLSPACQAEAGERHRRGLAGRPRLCGPRTSSVALLPPPEGHMPQGMQSTESAHDRRQSQWRWRRCPPGPSRSGKFQQLWQAPAAHPPFRPARGLLVPAKGVGCCFQFGNGPKAIGAGIGGAAGLCTLCTMWQPIDGQPIHSWAP